MLNRLVVKPAAAETLLKLEELEKELDLDEILSFRSMAECNLKGQVSSCFQLMILWLDKCINILLMLIYIRFVGFRK